MVKSFFERNAWILTAVLASVLFMPAEPARQIGLAPMREQYQGYLWIAFLLAGLFTIAGLLKYIDQRLVGWQAARQDAAKERKAKARLEETLRLRLGSLNDREHGLVMLCLFDGCQSYSAKAGHAASESLAGKGLVRRRGGTPFDVAYHFTDEAWGYLLRHRDGFLPEEQRNDPSVLHAVESVRQTLHDRY